MFRLLLFIGFLWSCGAHAQYSTGLVVKKGWSKTVQFAVPPMVRGQLPAHFDWREKAALSPIQNQGNCGSCWAFSIAATMVDAVSIKQGRVLSLSHQYLLSCNKLGYSCAAGGFFDAHDMHVSPGAVPVYQYPYTGRDSACRSNLTHPWHISSWHYIPGGTESSPPPIQALKAAIYAYGPISVGVAADSAMQSYRGGVFKTCKSRQLNHAVNIVGWDDNGGYWIMRNSWGANWGEKGYIRIKYGCNGIGTAANYVIP